MRSKSSPPNGFKRYLLSVVLLGCLSAHAAPEEVPEATVVEAVSPPSDEVPATPAPESPPKPTDEAAAIYMMKCMGCHTIGGGMLSGPDLKIVSGYPRQTVWDGVKRMEKNVGPLDDAEVDTLTDFLLSPDAATRLEVHRDQARMLETASMAPPNAEIGRALFLGSKTFENGAASCAACHQAGGRGGNLAVSLEDAYTRLGEQPLLATTESPGFPVMRAMYTPRPVTRQEAMHIVKFLEEVSKEPASPTRIPMHLAGIGGSIVVMVLLGKSTSKRAAGTRARMVADAVRQSDRGRKTGRNDA